MSKVYGKFQSSKNIFYFIPRHSVHLMFNFFIKKPFISALPRQSVSVILNLYLFIIKQAFHHCGFRCTSKSPELSNYYHENDIFNCIIGWHHFENGLMHFLKFRQDRGSCCKSKSTAYSWMWSYIQWTYIQRLNGRSTDAQRIQRTFQRPNGRSNGHWAFSTVIYYCLQRCPREGQIKI